MLGAPLPLKHVPVKAGIDAVTGKVVDTAKAVKDKTVTKTEPKKVDPEFEKTRIKPEESVSDVIQRKVEREALERKLQDWEQRQPVQTEATPFEKPVKPAQEALEGVKIEEAIPTQPEAGKEVPKPSEEVGAEQVGKKPPLARTDKEGNITVDETAAKAEPFRKTLMNRRKKSLPGRHVPRKGRPVK